MIDKGAMLKGFMKTFNISQEEFDYHIKYLDYYRLYVKTNDEIVKIKNSNGSREEIDKLRLALRQKWNEVNG